MKEIEYLRFSRSQHDRNLKNRMPSVCQFELTFQCGLRCKHCYSLCYNNPAGKRGELSTRQVKSVLDDLHGSGVLWLCLTGGDPLVRKDFSQIYAYARKKGFLVTVFTGGYSLTEKMADFFRDNPPFSIELTLHASKKKVYEKISQVAGSWEIVRRAVDLLMERRLPLKLKVQVMKDNIGDMPEMESFVKRLGIQLSGDPVLHARLDGDSSPCFLRISPEKLKFPENAGGDGMMKEGFCGEWDASISEKNRFFPCSITGGDGVYIDPYGAIVPCSCIRIPRIAVLEKGVLVSRNEILEHVGKMRWIGLSKCKTCALRRLCRNCPGNSLLENGDPGSPVEWFCRLARSQAVSFSREKINQMGGIYG